MFYQYKTPGLTSTLMMNVFSEGRTPPSARAA